MNMELKCPQCGTAFKVNESDYAAIQAQVRTAEFDAEVHRRIKDAEALHDAKINAQRANDRREMSDKLAEKDNELAQMRMQLLQLSEAIKNNDEQKRAAVSVAEANGKQRLIQAQAEKDRLIDGLNHEIERLKQQSKLDVMNERTTLREELHKRDNTISGLKSMLKAGEVAAENKIEELKHVHLAMMRQKDEEIQHYKDMRSRLSTKMLGETLEQHCRMQFDRARMQGLFATAYFDKDNEVRNGTKGDFIFRDFIDGNEYVSIMFEMKNEDENTVTKHKNADFFSKLDKDRREKNCEYAVLVTTLEADNELYNEGIVDMSFRYDKMYVVRPQFFMSVISMLSRSARRGAEQVAMLQRQLVEAQALSVDVTNFEKRRNAFVEKFGKLVSAHLKKQDDAMVALDKAIEAAERQAENLRKIKAAFESSRTKIIRANEVAENDFTIKKLCHGNPTMTTKFREARENANSKNVPLPDNAPEDESMDF